MDPVTVGTILVTVITGVVGWFKGTKADRQKAAGDAARSHLRWVAAVVVKQISVSARKQFGAQLSPRDAQGLLKLASDRALKMLEPRRAQIEKALGIDLHEVIRAELEIALADQQLVEAQKANLLIKAA